MNAITISMMSPRVRNTMIILYQLTLQNTWSGQSDTRWIIMNMGPTISVNLIIIKTNMGLQMQINVRRERQ